MIRTDEPFSVAVNAWNRALVIGETLEAIFKQTLPPAEVIVVDDGSSDDTVSVVRSFGSRVKLLSIENLGPGMSRDFAVRQCTQPWVACCDSDDIWRPTHLNTLAEIRRTVPEAVAVFTNSDYFGPNAMPKDHFSVIPDDWWKSAVAENFKNRTFRLKENVYLDLATDNPVYPSCLAFDLATYRSMGGANPEFSRLNSEDADITRRMALQGALAGSSDVTVSIRKNGDNFSVDYARNLLGNHDILMHHVSNDILPSNYIAPIKTAAARCAHKAFRQAYWARDYEFARQCTQLPFSEMLDWRDRIRIGRMLLKSSLGR